MQRRKKSFQLKIKKGTCMLRDLIEKPNTENVLSVGWLAFSLKNLLCIVSKMLVLLEQIHSMVIYIFYFPIK